MTEVKNILVCNDSAFTEEYAGLRHNLEEAQAMNRFLIRQLKKAQESAAEALRAHAKMVTTLTETMRENTVLTIERDTWKQRAQKSCGEHIPHAESDACTLLGLEHITEAEARAIRKAMARLHHPDSGGDPERMKAWNVMLDKIEYHQ